MSSPGIRIPATVASLVEQKKDKVKAQWQNIAHDGGVGGAGVSETRSDQQIERARRWLGVRKNDC